MFILLLVYFIYIILYVIVSYAILFHLKRFRLDGDKSNSVAMLYIVMSLVIIFGSIAFLRPT